MALSRSQTYKIALILLSISICISLMLFKGTVDDFVPKHIAKISETITNGGLIEPDGQVIQVPAFYILGAQIALISGFTPDILISLPVQLFPYAIVLFTLLYRVSGNPIISAALTMIDVCSGTTGTTKIFFWPHGLGYILFYVIILLLIIYLNPDRISKSSVFLCSIIVSSSLVYTSYNLTAMTLLLLISIIALSVIFHRPHKKSPDANKDYAPSRTIFTSFLVMSIVLLALSRFVYDVFIPTMDATQDLEITGLDKFLIAFINPNLSVNPLSPIMVHYDVFISIISGIKYALLAVTILIFCLLFMHSVIVRRGVGHVSLTIMATVLMVVSYSILRMMLGSIPITLLWLPGLLCIAYLSSTSKHLRKWTTSSHLKTWALATTIIILACTIFYYSAMEHGDHIERDEYQFSSYRAPVQWHMSNANDGLTQSDELTKNFFILYTYEYSTDHDDNNNLLQNITNQYKIMSTGNALAIVQLTNDTLDSKYYVLNKKTTSMSLNNWIIIQSWAQSKEGIEFNQQLNKIYDTSQLSTYEAA